MRVRNTTTEKPDCMSLVDTEKRESNHGQELLSPQIAWSAWYCRADMNDKKYGSTMPERELQSVSQDDESIGQNLTRQQ